MGCSASFCAQDMAQTEASRKKKSWGTMRGTYSSNLIRFGPYLKAPDPKMSGILAVFAFSDQVQRAAQGARPGDLLRFKKAITKTCGEWVGEHHIKRALLYLQKKWGATVKNWKFCKFLGSFRSKTQDSPASANFISRTDGDIWKISKLGGAQRHFLQSQNNFGSCISKDKAGKRGKPEKKLGGNFSKCLYPSWLTP